MEQRRGNGLANPKKLDIGTNAAPARKAREVGHRLSSCYKTSCFAARLFENRDR